jgi:hypothetical protein
VANAKKEETDADIASSGKVEVTQSGSGSHNATKGSGSTQQHPSDILKTMFDSNCGKILSKLTTHEQM